MAGNDPTDGMQTMNAIANGASRAAPAADVRRVPHRTIAAWLLACCALVFAMVVVGGVTRLTHSGLSIVEWQPLIGALPPLDEAQWAQTFAKYRETPEYRLRNHDMDVEGFKGIFWWEYFHRLLGRLIGVAFFVPFLWFWLRGRFDRPLALRLAGIFLLGGLQGAMGWYMVKSGLVDDPRVSQFRLTAHLGLALLIHAAMLWVALGLLGGPRAAAPAGLRRASLAFVGLVFAMALTGGLVAGIRAGFAYNTWPLMNGAWIPPEILLIEPWWMNFGYNMATVQFVHRTLALGVLAWALLLSWRVIATPGVAPGARLAAWAVGAATAGQVALGIATLLLVVPVSLGAAHQGGAVVVLSAAVWLARALRAGEKNP
jgi:heme a synthase